MAKSYSTKRSLLTSVISLVVCFAMLLGTTFAWFTDSVTSTNNKIVAGNLDVFFEYQNDETINEFGADEWFEVDENTNVFKEETLWEPGHVEVVRFKISNIGSLALKYQLGVNIASEQGSVNVNGEDFLLSDYIRYGIVEGDQILSTRTDAIAAVDATSTALKSPYTSADTELLPLNTNNDDNSDIVTVVVYMPETVGNEANYAKGEAIPEIMLGINLFATQYADEEDSFGNDYDVDAVYDKETPVARSKVLSKTTTFKNPDGVVVLDENFKIDTTNSKMGINLADYNAENLDTAYQFEPTISFEDVVGSKYEKWHADFVVSADQLVPAESIALAGYYDAWCSLNNDNWVAFTSDDPINANTEIRLIETFLGSDDNSQTVCMKDLAQYGNDGIGFLCGAVELKDKLTPGTTLTVELRLYEATDKYRGDETGHYISVGKYKYTFN